MTQKQTNPETIIQKLLRLKPDQQLKFSETQIKSICYKARQIFLQQPIVLELASPINIVGDIHGQFFDLMRLFKNGGFPPDANYLFLGDYVDRGQMSFQTLMLLLCYKIKYPENFFMLRGNHQSAEINKMYGFYDQCKRKYTPKIWKLFTDVFNCLPLAALIEDRIFCMHGGIGPDLNKISNLMKFNRPTDIPVTGVVCDLLWSDPADNQKGFSQNKERGIGSLFGADALKKFLDNNNLDLICRSHQIVEGGYEFFGKRQLVTIFSAPNYCGQFQNLGALMKVDQNLICSFQVIKSDNKVKNHKNLKSSKYVT